MLSLVGMYDNDSIAMTQVKIRELFEQAAELEAYHLKEKGIELCYFCDEESGKLDKDLMVSLLINLIDNAVKASRQGDKITLGKEGNVIFVEDQGCGIPKDELARVTEAFYMVDKARSRKEGGSGLGLALCSRIAGLHGAKMEIESELQKGTRVSLVFEEWWEKK